MAVTLKDSVVDSGSTGNPSLRMYRLRRTRFLASIKSDRLVVENIKSTHSKRMLAAGIEPALSKGTKVFLGTFLAFESPPGHPSSGGLFVQLSSIGEEPSSPRAVGQELCNVLRLVCRGLIDMTFRVFFGYFVSMWISLSRRRFRARFAWAFIVCEVETGGSS